MSKAVLISIRPEWCKKIASGQKTIEVRKTRPKIETPFKCYIYCTEGKLNDDLWLRRKGCVDKICNGKVIGEFVCDGVLSHCESSNADLAEQQGCIRREKLFEYSQGRELYGWHISDLVIYDKPKELVAFRKPCFNFHICEYCVLDSEKCKYDIPIERPPQSWCYVEEL